MEIGNVVGPADGQVPAKFRHELRHGRFLVAEFEGQMAGFGAVFQRKDVAFLATFYVHPDAQNAGLGVGQLLMDALFEGLGPARCVVSSDVHRAIAIYARNGLLPRWPLFMLEADTDRLVLPSEQDLDVVAAHPGDPELLRWDAAIGNRGERPDDHEFWRAEYCASPCWIVREGVRIGYAHIQRLLASPDAPWNPKTVFLGPIGVLDDRYAAAAVMAVVEAARSSAPRLALDLPGGHPALASLLEAGFRIFYQATFCSSSATGAFDPRCYVPADTITL